MKKKYLVLTIILLLLTSCTSPSEKPMDTNESSIFETAEVKNVKILRNGCDVKSGAGESFDTIGTLNQNDVANVLGKVGDWYVIKLDNNRVGCVNNESVQPVIKETDTAKQPNNIPNSDQTQPNQPNTGNNQEPNTNNQTPNNQPDTTPNTNQNNTQSPANPVKRLTDQEQRMVELVNMERTKNDLPPLEVDLELARVARIKAQDMAENNYFSHYSPNYGSPFDMMKSFGIEYLHAGENLAGNSGVENAHNALMNSSGHRKNILSPDFTHIGIGITPSDKYGYIYTQMFISKPK
ncbi:CAP domain-containing protein [Sporosalibacterium faouarense]|uniref:CAP domain-containing protein n=1 Tax=Sporosalibacterium faouarense TaxID=516123 RepID=UPI00192AAE31|nr:CAP domain-containing protein [Sporosalibacterium faouarense]